MMEIDDIKKIESRKRMSTDVEKLRDKVSRETAKIIKLKVSQDTAYWDLKEKLEQVENNHERLQQNMVEVQMQREAISGQYQEELRLRPEILNKLSSTREICDVLEDYSERLKQTLSRCKADQVALCDAYQKSSAIVRDARSKQEQIDQRNRQLIESLQEKVKLVSEHHNQTVQFLTAAKQHAESELADVKAELNSMRKRSDQLLATVGDLTRDVDKYRNESVQKDKMLANIREEMNKTFEEYNKHICEARDNIINKEKELKEATDMCNSLRQALSNQEEFTKSVCDARNALQEKVASLEDGQAELITAMDQLKIQLEDTASAKAALKGEIEKETAEKNRLLKEIFDYQQVTTNSEKEIQQLRMEINTMEEKNSRLAEDLERAKCELNEKCNNIEELLDREKHLHTNIESYREATEDKIKSMEVELQNKDKEIDSKSNTINQLMSEVKTGTDARCKLEGIVQKLKKEMELAKNVAMEKQQKLEKQIEQLEVSIRVYDITRFK
ncbi:synaptonemal complex protein 1-like [Battus philenor]|uniref:synaptonemal complex protein 1-like n=1 Tax=Battus philenor TaxID=42288 RepID=UPI0035CF9146